MKKVFITTISVFFICIFISTASAATIHHITNISGNDPSNSSADLTELKNIVQTWYNNDTNQGTLFSTTWSADWDLEFYAKVDAPSKVATEGTGSLSLSYTDNKSGSWTAGDNINLFSVKASNGYALYWLEGAASSGDWTTIDVQDKDISHLSTWKIKGGTPPTDPVPEPGTLAMLGLGLIAIAGFGRKRYTF